MGCKCCSLHSVLADLVEQAQCGRYKDCWSTRNPHITAVGNSHECSNNLEPDLAYLLEDSCECYHMNLLTELRE